MQAYNMKQNLANNAFNVSVGKFLGYMVTQRRIKVNPTQVKVVLETPILSSKRELQRLIGRLTTLRRFIAHFTDKLWHFFLTFKGASMFGWTYEYKQAFEVIKRYLTEPPSLSSPKFSEELYMYLTVFDCVINAVLFWHIRDKK